MCNFTIDTLKKLEKIELILDMQLVLVNDKNGKTNKYHHGFYDGVQCVRAVLLEIDPLYIAGSPYLPLAHSSIYEEVENEEN